MANTSTKIMPYTDIPPWPWYEPSSGNGIYTYTDRKSGIQKTIDRSELGGWVAFLIVDEKRDSGFRQEWAMSGRAYETIREYQGVADVRMSWNTFYSTSSSPKNVLDYYCCFVDLDYRKIQLYKDVAPEDMSDILLKLCFTNDLQEPSIVISSGNGLHVAWRFAIPSMARGLRPRWQNVEKSSTAIEKFYDKLIDWDKFNEYNRMQRELAKVFAHIGADPIAIDAGKYMRLPGSINTKAEKLGRDGLVRILHEGPRVYRSDLRVALGVPCMSGPHKGEAPAVKHNTQRKETKGEEKKSASAFQVMQGGVERPDVIDTKEKTWGTWVNVEGARQWVLWEEYNALRYWDLYVLMELRREKNGGTIPEGERSNFLTWLLNFWGLWNLESLDDAEFNKVFPRVFQILADQIDPAYRKGDKYAAMRVRTIQKKWGQGWVSWCGKATTALYTPRTSTLVEKFGITAEEIPYLVTFQPVDTKERQTERKKEQRRREGVRPREEYLKNTVTAMAAAEGISPKTWRRRHPEYIGEKKLKKHPELGAQAE